MLFNSEANQVKFVEVKPDIQAGMQSDSDDSYDGDGEYVKVIAEPEPI